MQSLQTALRLVPRLVAAAIWVARGALANAAVKYRDRRILERLSATELEDIGLCRAADGAIDFRPRCPDEAEPNVAGIATLYGSHATAAGAEQARSQRWNFSQH